MDCLHFEVMEEKRKTNVYAVKANRTTIASGRPPRDEVLGVVMWEPRKRQYTFAPNSDAEPTFSADCLRQIINFLKELKKNPKLNRPLLV